jgi:ATPase subunit of ABC transporter with duplicated ATPase domains
VDIDFAKVNAYTGNYSFWYQSSQLALKQRQNQNKKTEDKRKEMQAFIDRFSANASKSRQATSRKKMLDKLVIDDIKPSSRKYPGIIFKAERSVGKQLLGVKGLSANAEDGSPLFTNLDFEMNQEDKIAIISNNSLATTALYEILNGKREADAGTYEFGQTITTAYLPNDNESYFKDPVSLIDWLRQYSDNKDEAYIRGFLGQMLFSGQETLKMCNVLSGGEKVRCMLSRMIMAQANILIMDEPTNHLDLESITALNNAMTNFAESVLFTSHDHEITSTVANRIIEIGPNGFIDSLKTYDEYMNDDGIQEQRKGIV